MWNSETIKKLLITNWRPLAVGLVLLLSFWNRSYLYKRFIEAGAVRSDVIYIGGPKDLSRRGDIVFIHGLNGHPFDTWGDKKAEFYWPTWLSKQFPDTCVWTIQYEAAASKWKGSPMSIGDRSENLLSQLRLKGIGDRPILFICHSLGGILAKQMLEDGATLQNPKYEIVTNETKGVAFLATPHSGSDAAVLANLVRLYRPSGLTDDLTRDNDRLRKLNTWYANNAPLKNIGTCVLGEKLKTDGVLVVSESSANPGITGVFTIFVDETHLSISKPGKADNQVCQEVSVFIKEYLQPPPNPVQITMQDFVAEYAAARSGGSLSEVKTKYKGRQFTWTAYVRASFPQKENDLKSHPAYVISEKPNTKGEWFVSAKFARFDTTYNPDLKNGDHVVVSGVFDDVNTNLTGLFLNNCKLIQKVSSE